VNWFVLAVFGGMVGLDATSFPQIMISRPLVAAILGGLAAGHPGVGAAVGIVVETFHLAILPIGASRYPEAGTAAAAAAFALAAAGIGAGPVALLVTLGLALIWGRVAAVSVGITRHVNERLVGGSDPQLSAAALEVRHMAAMAIDFCRGSVITVAGAAISCGLLWVAVSFRADAAIAQGGLAVLLCGAAAGALTVFGGVKERRYSFLAGAAIGTALVLLI